MLKRKLEENSPHIPDIFIRIQRMGGVFPSTGRSIHVSFEPSITEGILDRNVLLTSLKIMKLSSTVKKIFAM